MIDDGTGFIRFSMTSFVIKFISCTTTSLAHNSIHYYLLFIFKFVVWLFKFQRQLSLECPNLLH
jgi:hypothetical protein